MYELKYDLTRTLKVDFAGFLSLYNESIDKQNKEEGKKLPRLKKSETLSSDKTVPEIKFPKLKKVTAVGAQSE